MRFVYDEQANVALKQRQELLHELRIAQPLRRDHQQIHLIGQERAFDLLPLVQIFTVNGCGAQTDAFRGQELIAHQRQQRTDEQRRSSASFANDFSREKIDDTLAPARPLNHQNAATLIGCEINCLPLTIAKVHRLTEHLPQQHLRLRLNHRQESVRGRVL